MCMMKKTILILIILPLIMTSFQCAKDNDNCHKNIIIENNSDKTLRIFSSLEYPDSTLKSNNEATLYPIEPHSSYLDYWGCVENVFRRNKHGVLLYFIIDNEILKNNPMDTIVEYKMYIKKYDLTEESLQKMNWTITYP